MTCPVLSLDKLFFSEKGGEVEKMDYLELIVRVTSHIPDKRQVMVRYYGLNANAHRGKAIKAGGAARTLSITECSKRPCRGWASMIRKVYEVDPMVCPVCSDRMCVMATLTDYTVVDRIIEHLNLIFVS